MKSRRYLRAVAPQLILISIVVVLKLLSAASLLPPPEQLAGMLVDLLLSYGLPLVVLASFLENFAGLGTYFPGSVALLAAMAATAGDPSRAFKTYLAVLIPAIAANMLSYGVGHLSTQIKETRPRSNRALTVWYVSTYWHPQLAGVSAVASAAEGISFKRYVAFFLPISTAWSVFWALVLYNFGDNLASPRALTILFYLYLGGWLIWGLIKYRRSTPTSVPSG